MKQSFLSIVLLSLFFLTGCGSTMPRMTMPRVTVPSMTWLKLPGWKKQTDTEVADKTDNDNKTNKFNPFKRNKKKADDIALADSKKTTTKEASKVDRMIDDALVDATEAERTQMKRDLKGRDIAMVRSVLNVWKNVRRVKSKSFEDEDLQQASSSFPIVPEKSNTRQKQDHPFRLTSDERSRNNKTVSNNRDNKSGLGATHPWNDSPFGQNNKTITQQNQQPLTSQLLAGHSTDTIVPSKRIPSPSRDDDSLRKPLPEKSGNPFDRKVANDREMKSKFPAVQPVDYTETKLNGDLPAGNQQADAYMRHLEKLIALTEDDLAAIKENPDTTLSEEEQQRQYVEQQVYLRMLYLMAGEQVRSFDTIPGIPAADQEFWRQLFWGMANYFDHTAMPDARTRATQTVAQLQQATLRLQANANLQLRNLNFCHKIASFGNYETFKDSEFRPGQRVLLYSEVQNFKSDPSEDGKFYRTMLKSNIAIHRVGSTGGTVAEFQFDPAEDLCRNYRKDYFHSYEIAIPENITLGPHVLTLTVTDQLGDKIATETLKFNVK